MGSESHGCAADKSAEWYWIWTKISEECLLHLVECEWKVVQMVYCCNSCLFLWLYDVTIVDWPLYIWPYIRIISACYSSCHSCTIPGTVLPFRWNSVFPRVNLPDHLSWQSLSDLFKKQISIWLILNDSHEWLLFVIRFVLGFLFMRRCFNSIFAFTGTPVGRGDGCLGGS